MELEGMLVVEPKECERCLLWRQAASLGRMGKEEKLPGVSQSFT